jgi:hypothetical protein
MFNIEHRIVWNLGNILTGSYSKQKKKKKEEASNSQTLETLNIDQLEGKRLELWVKV